MAICKQPAVNMNLIAAGCKWMGFIRVFRADLCCNSKAETADRKQARDCNRGCDNALIRAIIALVVGSVGVRA